MMGSSTMVCLLFILGLCSLTLSVSPQYRHVNIYKNYSEAKSYCREMYTDLASVHNSEDMDSLIASVPNRRKTNTWIGLERGDLFKWHWSLADEDFYDEGEREFLNWRAGEPKENNDQDSCAAMDPSGKWFEDDCKTKRGSICFDGKNINNTSYIYIPESKSWREAQDHCRNIITDLVSIRSPDENQMVQNVSQSQSVWIGLFKDPWRWSDSSNSSFRFWKPRQPNNFRGQDCVAVVFKNPLGWNDLKCKINRRFICQGERKSVTHAPTNTQTTTQQPVTTAQLLTTTDLLPSPSQNITPALQTTVKHTVVTSTEQSNTDNIYTEQATTHVVPAQNITSTFPTTQFNTTQHVSTNQLSTEHLNSDQTTTSYVPVQNTSTLASTTLNTTMHVLTEQSITEHITSDETTTGYVQISTLAPTKFNTIEHVSTEQSSTEHITSNQATTGYLPTSAQNMTTKEEITHSQTTETAATEIQHTTQQNTDQTYPLHMTTLEGTVSYSTAEPATVVPTENSQGLVQDNLILIRENMTWMEALSYCREHHVDLVSVTTEVIQDWVTERAVNASSAHVWLGLRFTCTFNFWFWVRSDTGCYHNWAPGHGSYGLQDCGNAGAIEATGGQQWVSLPETDKLNFICHMC